MADRKSQRRCRVKLDARLADRGEVPRAGAPAFPVPLWARVDDLVKQANGVGAETTRAELIAAWLVSTTPSAETMRQWVEDYRATRVREVVSEAGGETRTFVLRDAGRPRG